MTRPADPRHLTVLESFRTPRPTTNPYLSQLLTSVPPHVTPLAFSWRTALTGRYDVLHVHWPEVLLRAGTRPRTTARLALASLLLARITLCRTAVVRTLHNAEPHEQTSRAERALLRWFDRRTTLWVRLNETTTPPTGAPAVTILHGHYRDWFAEHPHDDQVPGRLLFFGLVRPYKGVEQLLTALAALRDDTATLRVVGRPSAPDLREAIEAAARNDGRISSRLEYVDDATLTQEISRAQLVVLPYRELHNSGAALLALSLDRPILVPAGPAVEQLAREVGREWVMTFTGTLGVADLEAALLATRGARGSTGPDLSARDWPALGAAHAAAFAEAVRLAHAPGRRSAGPAGPDAATPRVEVVFRQERDVEAWSARHAAGEVPSRWPYGLDLLGTTGAQVRAVGVPEPTRLTVARATLRPARRRPTGGHRDIGVAWDEHVARRMLLGSPHAEMYSGAIWVTDALAANPDDPRALATLATLRAMDGVFVISRAQVEPLRAALGPGGPDVSFFPFGIDADFFAARPYPTRPLVMSIGGDRDRDPTTLFAALALVAARRPEVEIVVQSASDMAAPPGVVKVPRLTHRELRDLYARATVVAIATRPNLHVSGMTVMLEAMATARPVVLTGSPGVEDYATDGETALLVPTRDEGLLADRVLGLLADPDDAQALGERARASVEARLTSAHMVQELARVIGLVD